MQRGFTLIEIVLALLILGILSSIGWGSLQQQLPRFRMIRTARSFKSDVMNLQNLAIQTNRETRLMFTSSPGDCSDGDWGGSWQMSVGNRASNSMQWDLLPPDTFDDNADNDSSEANIDIGLGGNRQSKSICLRHWGAFKGPGTGNGDSVVFSPRGWVTNPGGDFGESGYIEITFVNQIAALQGVEDEVSVAISRAGMVRLATSKYPETSVGTASSSTSR